MPVDTMHRLVGHGCPARTLAEADSFRSVQFRYVTLRSLRLLCAPAFPPRFCQMILRIDFWSGEALLLIFLLRRAAIGMNWMYDLDHLFLC